MMDEATRQIDDELDAFRDARPGAYQLARILSLAARIEPALVRRARLLAPQLDASAEADLWASTLAATTAQGIVFDPEHAAVLRRRLAADPELFRSAAALIAWEHRNAPWPIRAEEAINLRTASGSPEDAAGGELVLLATARQMVEATDRVGAARWVMRTLTRLPPSLGASSAARALQAGIGAQLDGRLDIEGDLPADTVENWLPWLFAGVQSRSRVRLSLGDGFLEVDASESAAAGSDTIEIPSTSPLLLDLRWHDGLAPHSARVSLERGDLQRVAINATSLEVRAIDGTRAAVRLAGAREQVGGIDFAAVRARHRPFVGREQDLNAIDDQLRSGVRVIGIIGPPGIGKTALLCAFLDRLEARGEHVVIHFLEGGPESWRDPTLVQASLESQAARYSPSTVPTGEDLESLKKDWRVYYVIDGVGRTAFVDTSASGATRLLYTAEAVPGEPAASLRDQLTIDLAQEPESNLLVCTFYLDLHRVMLGRKTGTRSSDRRLKVFLSYSRIDAALVDLILPVLHRQEGIEVFSNDTSIRAGADWVQELTRMFDEADLVVLFATRKAAESQGLTWEIGQVARRSRALLCLSNDVNFARRHPAFESLASSRFIEITEGSNWVSEVADFLQNLRSRFREGTESIERELLSRCDSNIGRLVSMVDWIRAQPDGMVTLEWMPPTLYGAFERTWADALGRHGDTAAQLLGLLAVAKAPIQTAAVRSSFVRDIGNQTMLADLVRLGLIVATPVAPQAQPDRTTPQATEGQVSGTVVSLSHETVRAEVVKKLLLRDTRRFHQVLADYDDPEYALRYRLAHMVGAGHAAGAIDLVSDVRLLTRICTELGVDYLESQLLEIAEAARGEQHEEGGGSKVSA